MKLKCEVNLETLFEPGSDWETPVATILRDEIMSMLRAQAKAVLKERAKIVRAVMNKMSSRALEDLKEALGE